ncbi:hypothetical protein KUTeg_024708 [Tegillarca granosa]|uniref:Sigma intracellular receptor 2 n=1 Tax=Tegillarca granosa TaxID=220873 RepID=A0ABQ9DYV2_TEGGR|nr:hypothetical protein KUTeg_024708 [Tegillarca granosa]
MNRILDYIFFLYFASHIPITIFVDSQVLLPKWFYPKQLLDLKDWYCREYRDPMMVAPPAWFKTFVYCEMLVQFPFFFVALFAFWKGIEQCKWIRIPLIVYSTHVATTTIAICYHIYAHDFRTSAFPGPESMPQRLLLLSFYFPYLLIPVMSLIDALFSSVYRQDCKKKIS